MGDSSNLRNLLLGSLSLGLVGAVGLVALLVLGWVNFDDNVAYPGAAQVSDHRIVHIYPQFTVRRDTSYRTQDAFPLVYDWYSRGFALGPEKAAISTCIYLEDTTQLIVVLEQHMSVYLCDTASGRMIWVERTLALRP